MTYVTRFGRLQEGFGEEPALVAAFARAAAIGLQGELERSHSSSSAGHSVGHSRSAGSGAAEAAEAAEAADGMRGVAATRRALGAAKVLAVGKHFLGYGAAEGGLNGGMVRPPHGCPPISPDLPPISR